MGARWELSGMHDWTMEGIHLCNLRLQLLRLNTMPAMDAAFWRISPPFAGLPEAIAQTRAAGRIP